MTTVSRTSPGGAPPTADPTPADPRAVVDALAGAVRPYLIGVRHHSPALAAVVPALLDAAAAEVVCIELPADFQRWLPYLSDPAARAPLALVGSHGEDGPTGFYPFADFSPELAAIRWARQRGVEVVCCDLPLTDPGWSADSIDPATDSDPTAGSEPTAGGDPDAGEPVPGLRRSGYAAALSASGTGRDGDDLWDRVVEVRAPGCPPEAVRRAALGVGWAMRTDSAGGDGIPARDLARERHMRRVLAEAGANGRRVAAVIGAFHAPALLAAAPAAADGAPALPAAVSTDAADAPTRTVSTADAAAPTGKVRSGPAATDCGGGTAITSLVPYAFDLLDSRSGYPAGIRDPRWQQSVFTAAGDPERIRAAAARAVTDLCRELRSAGHTAGTGEAAETVRLAGDLARLRNLPAPGRGEVLEAVTTVLGQGELLGRGRALARALETVLVGAERGRIAPGTPRSGLGPAVEAELTALRLPSPDSPKSREVRLDPLRTELDGRREILLQRLQICGIGYGEPIAVSGTGDGAALTTRWQLAWTPSVAARLDLVGVRGVTAALAAAGTLRERFRREATDGGPTAAQLLTGLRDAARCDLPELVTDRLELATVVLPGTGTLPELLAALDLLEALRREHLPGTTADGRARAAELAVVLLDAAVRGLPGLAGSDAIADAAALVDLAVRAGEDRIGLRLDEALGHLAQAGSPLIQGAALAARVLLDLTGLEVLGSRVAGWIDAATGPDTRRHLHRLLGGLLTAAHPLLQSAPAALDPLLERIERLTDTEFLDRLPALRGGFDVLTPAARDRLLHTVADRLGDRLELALSVPPELLARWTAADLAGRAALIARDIPIPGPSSGSTDAQPGPDTPTGSTDAEPGPDTPAAQLTPTNRWRLLLGRQPDRLPADARRYARALDELYGAGQGEGATDLGQAAGGGQEASFPTAREWADELEALFGTAVREEVIARAAENGRTDVLIELDPAAVRPSMELLTSVLSLAGGLPEGHLAKLRPLVRRLVEELTKQLATQVRPALTGLTNPRPSRRPGGRINLARTLQANLRHTQRLHDGRTVVVPERPVFNTRTRREADWRLVLVVDVSGSMEASVVWSALTAAVLAGVPTLSTHFLAFSTQVADLTDRVDDPLSLLLEVRVGGGTHIAAGLAHARSLVTVPSRTIVAVVSDFEEGYPLAGLLGEVRTLASSGVHLLGCAALNDRGVPCYSVPVAEQLVAAGMPVAALSPLELARWVGDRIRGGSR
ncbi:vWA domain-containing protein [Micromonospora sp. NBC_01412]|uniref:vWA domain-containing protein n=1 Tax=Micromonospora sp. NBC_01412 TaxID=2903590 RepID=UPI00324D5A35